MEPSDHTHDTGWKLEVWSGRFDRRPDSCRKEYKKRTNAEGGDGGADACPIRKQRK